MKKIILFFLLLAILMTTLSVTALASDRTDGISSETVSEGECAVEAEEAESEGDATLFTSLYEAYEMHRGELFSFLSALVSLVLVFVYQKGLLPILKSGIGLIEGQVKGLGEVSRSAKEYQERVSEQTLALALEMQNSTEEMRALTDSLLSRTEESEKRDGELSEMKHCILLQAKLLGEVFLASSLPEYSKERVGRVVSEVESMLSREQDITA